MQPATSQFLSLLAPAITSDIDECLHCTVAGNGPLASTSGITTQTLPRATHEDILEDLHALATTPEGRAQIHTAHGFHLFWLFNQVYLASPTATPDLTHALRRMACRVEWGELWKISRCPEPAMKSYEDALAFLRERLPHHPQWQKSLVHPLLA